MHMSADLSHTAREMRQTAGESRTWHGLRKIIPKASLLSKIANIGDTDQSFDAYFAIYEKGALKSVRKIVANAPAREVSYNFMSEKITAQEEGDLKILFWEKDGLKPLEDAQLQ